VFFAGPPFPCLGALPKTQTRPTEMSNALGCVLEPGNTLPKPDQEKTKRFCFPLTVFGCFGAIKLVG
jgi:hypothetical protein